MPIALIRRVPGVPGAPGARRHRRSWRARSVTVVVALLLAAVLGGAPPEAAAAPRRPAQTPTGWYIDADQLSVNAPMSDTSDTPAIAVVAFRTRPGVPGSTRVWAASTFRQVCSGARAGTSCTIPDHIGRIHFGGVAMPTMDEIRAGARPEIIGTVHLVSDVRLNPNGHMDEELFAQTARFHDTLVRLSEDLPATSFSSADQVAATATDLIDRLWSEGNIYVGLAAPEKLTAMVGVSRSLHDPVNLSLLRRFSPSPDAASGITSVAAAALHPRSVIFRHDLVLRDGWYHGPDHPPLFSYFVSQRVFYVPGRLGD